MSQAPQDAKPSTANSQATPAADSIGPAATGWLSDYPWVVFVLPFAVFMLAGSLEPTAAKPFEMFGLTIPYSAYPLAYAAKIALTCLAMAAVWPGYRQFPLRLSPLAPLIGAVGVVLWIGICKLHLEDRLFASLPFDALADLGQRSAFDPLARWPDEPLSAYGFLAVRFFGLAIVVPVIEEFFLRGFVMRFVVAADWWKVPFGTLTPTAILVGTLLPVVMHPSEALAAAVWFTLVTWLMFKTKNIWDCVAAHAVTNLLLGAWVVASGDWYFL